MIASEVVLQFHVMVWRDMWSVDSRRRGGQSIYLGLDEQMSRVETRGSYQNLRAATNRRQTVEGEVIF